MGPELVQSTNKAIQKIRSRMHTAQSRQKSYADVRRKDLEFEIGDKAGLLQPLSIPEWKWENVSMDFITGLPRTLRGFTVIWVVVDRLTKSAHFVPGKSTYTASKWAQLYMSEIVRLHGVPVSIVLIEMPVSLPNSGRVCRLLWARG